MQCSGCKKDVSARDVFCPHCGMEVQRQVPEQGQATSKKVPAESRPKPDVKVDQPANLAAEKTPEATPQDTPSQRPKEEDGKPQDAKPNDPEDAKPQQDAKPDARHDGAPVEPESPAPSPGADSKPQSPAVSSTETPRRDDQQASEGGVSQKPEVNNSAFRDFNNIVTTINVSQVGGGVAISLVDYVTDLPEPPLTDPTAAAFLQTELRAQFDCLQRDRMILVSCSDPRLSRAAVSALIEQLNVPQLTRKMLNFDRLPADTLPSIYQLMSKPIQKGGQAVVVVDAARSERAQAFVDAMHRADGNWSSLDRTKSLRDAGLWLICEIDPERIARSVTSVDKLPVACWSVSYLRFLLRPRFPDTYVALETTITRQRATGGWASEVADFHKQITSLANEDLVEAISKGGIAAITTLQNEVSASHPLHVAILYTAAFFPNLGPHDFGRVLTMLLGRQKMMVTETIHQKGKSGILEPVELKRERELVQIWNEESDAILRACGLMTTRGAQRRIAFADPGRRDQLRKHFEEAYGIYVHRQFVAVYEHNLLFDGSEQVAQDVIALTIDMSASYDDHFDAEWLAAVVVRACEHLPADDAARSNQTYQHIAELLRAMLGDPRLAPRVAGLFRKLLAGAHHQFVFEVLKKLRFAPGFDVFLWLRQAIDTEGADETRSEAYAYLYDELTHAGRTYPLLYTLQDWLPASDRVTTAEQSEAMALQLIFNYCLNETVRFDRRHSGTWPSRFPLLAVDIDNATANLGLIIRCLTHPALGSVLTEPMPPEELDRLLAALIAEWVFILLGPPAEDDRSRFVTTGTRSSGSAAAAVMAEGVVEVLVSRLVDATSVPNQRHRQETMVAYWEDMKQYFLDCIASTDAEERRNAREFTWKRELIRKVITRFREAQRSLRASSRMQRASA